MVSKKEKRGKLMQLLNVLSLIMLTIVVVVSFGLKIYTRHVKRDMDGFDGEITSNDSEIHKIVDWF